jgi:DNA-binding response OmpR family regulator
MDKSPPLCRNLVRRRSVNVLLVSRTWSTVASYLLHEGIGVATVVDGPAAQHEVSTRAYDCILVDREQAGDVMVILQTMRPACDVPILIIATSPTVDERCEVLDAGADDCIAAECGPRELIGRIEATVRRLRRFVEW